MRIEYLFDVGWLENLMFNVAALGGQHWKTAMPFWVSSMQRTMRYVVHHSYRKGLHNYAHPRTDPVVIMIAVDDTRDKVLLGRGVN